MPTRSDHLEAAKKAERFVDRVLSDVGGEFAEWGIVGLFYAAVHYGRAYVAAISPTAITSHVGFESHFLRLTGDRSLYRYYRQLKDEAERARYDCVAYVSGDVVEVRRRLFEPWRDRIMALMPRDPRGERP